MGIGIWLQECCLAWNQQMYKTSLNFEMTQSIIWRVSKDNQLLKIASYAWVISRVSMQYIENFAKF